jgi:formylglycine-generating enzyme required for sulfatase activity
MAATPDEDAVWIPPGRTTLGSTDFYPEERPLRDVDVDGFWMDRHPVTVAQFRRFVRETGHVTVAERAPTAEEVPGADPAALVAGSLVFAATPGPVPLDEWWRWWRYVPGARWDEPEGPGSDVYTRGRHPVTHVGYDDAVAYAAWAGKDLPTEEEWEHAAWGGRTGTAFWWGDELDPGGRPAANWWRGPFPWGEDPAAPWRRTSPVDAFAPNPYGLLDICGNVWEWTHSRYTGGTAGRPCCAPAGDGPGLRVIKGGSHLCSPDYCLRFRPAARQGQDPLSSTSHIGLRCVRRPAAGPAYDPANG